MISSCHSLKKLYLSEIDETITERNIKKESSILKMIFLLYQNQFNSISKIVDTLVKKK